MTGENLDISSDPGKGHLAAGASRPFIGVRFACCDVYTRLYINKDRTAYQGHCPRCGKPVQAKIAPDGQTERFFTVW